MFQDEWLQHCVLNQLHNPTQRVTKITQSVDQTAPKSQSQQRMRIPTGIKPEGHVMMAVRMGVSMIDDQGPRTCFPL